MKFKAVVFDLDNTLTDFMKMKDASVWAAAEAMVDAGLKTSVADVHAGINAIYREKGIEYQQVFDHFLQATEGRIDPKVMAAGIVGYRRARESTLVLYPHVSLALHGLIKRGLKLAVVSDAPTPQAWLRICQLQLQHLFDAVVTYDDTGRRKPDPAPFSLALERLGIAAADAIMIGDWPERDVVGAKALGMTTIFARYGDTFGTTPGQSGADFEIDDIIDLLEIVDRLNAAPGASARS